MGDSDVNHGMVADGWEQGCEATASIPEARIPAVRRRGARRGSMEEDEYFMSLLHGSDPVKIELNRLENELKDKDRELAEAQNEIKALKLTERAKEKALEEVTEELGKILDKYQASETTIENKNLEIKRITEEKREAIAAQFAAEATLRRVHAAQKDEEIPPIEDILAPLEAEIRILRQEVSNLQDDNKASERLMKSKEIALLEAEKEVQMAKVKAALVDDVLNKNQELMKQNDICQEEYKILDRMHRQKVAEVEKLGNTINELEESLLNGAASANAARDFQRQCNELKEEKRILERTLSRAKVTENRAAVVIANEWKDANDKVIPVKQWLEERRFLMGEMQHLREKLSIAERTSKAEAQLKEKYQLRLKFIEDGLKSSFLRSSGSRTPRYSSIVGDSISPQSLNRLSYTPLLQRSLSLSRHSVTKVKHARSSSKSFDVDMSSRREESQIQSSQNSSNNKSLGDTPDGLCTKNLSVNIKKETINYETLAPTEGIEDDFVSGILYDILQKEVIALKKACNEKDQCLNDRDSSIEMLSRKVDALNKAMDTEAKKMYREKAVMAKEIATIRSEKEQEKKFRRSKATTNNCRN